MTPDERAHVLSTLTCAYCRCLAWTADDEPVRGIRRWHHPRCGRPKAFDPHRSADFPFITAEPTPPPAPPPEPEPPPAPTDAPPPTRKPPKSKAR